MSIILQLNSKPSITKISSSLAVLLQEEQVVLIQEGMFELKLFRWLMILWAESKLEVEISVDTAAKTQKHLLNLFWTRFILFLGWYHATRFMSFHIQESKALQDLFWDERLIIAVSNCLMSSDMVSAVGFFKVKWFWWIF